MGTTVTMGTLPPGTQVNYLADQMNQQVPQAINMSGAYSGASSGLQDIMKQLTASQNQANAANQQRYTDILGMYSSLGTSGAQQIAEQTAQQQAKSTSDLTSRGLGNTTVTSAMSNQIASLGQSNQLALQESLTGKEAGVMEAMNQKGPDLSMYSNLIQQAMAGQTANRQRTVSGGTGGTYQAGGWNPANQGASASAYGGGQAQYSQTQGGGQSYNTSNPWGTQPGGAFAGGGGSSIAGSDNPEVIGYDPNEWGMTGYD